MRKGDPDEYEKVWTALSLFLGTKDEQELNDFLMILAFTKLLRRLGPGGAVTYISTFVNKFMKVMKKGGFV